MLNLTQVGETLPFQKILYLFSSCSWFEQVLKLHVTQRITLILKTWRQKGAWSIFVFLLCFFRQLSCFRSLALQGFSLKVPRNPGILPRMCHQPSHTTCFFSLGFLIEVSLQLSTKSRRFSVLPHNQISHQHRIWSLLSHLIVNVSW